MEIVRLLSRALLGPGKRAVVLGPAWGEYSAAARNVGAEVAEIRAREGDGFRWDFSRTAAEIREARPDVLFLCNPCNPTGVYLEADETAEILAAAGSALSVVDEAYIDFVDSPWISRILLERGNTVILRSFTKTFSLWPVRAGYALGNPEILARLEAVREPGALSPHVEAVGMAALEAGDHPRLAREAVREGLGLLDGGLRGMGLETVRGGASFMLVRVPEARAAWRELRLRGILVRDCSSFGLPGFLRVGAPPAHAVPGIMRAFAAAADSLRQDAAKAGAAAQ
jgi:histidinol-phosphate aminotransferase